MGFPSFRTKNKKKLDQSPSSKPLTSAEPYDDDDRLNVSGDVDENNTNLNTGGGTLVTPDKQQQQQRQRQQEQDSPSSTPKARNNLKSLLDTSNDSGVEPPEHKNNVSGESNGTGGKRFLPRFRSRTSKRQQQQQQQQNQTRQQPVAGGNNTTAVQHGNTTTVPQYVNQSNDDSSIPSLITEPEDVTRFLDAAKLKDGKVKKVNNGSKNDDSVPPLVTPPSSPNKSMERTSSSRVSKSSGGNSQTTSQKPSIAGGSGGGKVPGQGSTGTYRDEEDIVTNEDDDTRPTATTTTSARDKKSRGTNTTTTTTTKGPNNSKGSFFDLGKTGGAGLGGILQVFQCSEDTTLGCAAIKCHPLVELCGPMKDDPLAEGMDEEERFAVEFLNELIKNGIKLIYHESPTTDSSGHDWRQGTVKLFIRPGNCHERKLKHPTLAWAVLPVVTRTRIGAVADDGSSGMWHFLPLLDIYSILAADEDIGDAEDEDGVESPARSKRSALTYSVDGSWGGTTRGSRGGASVPSSGFFSITANTGDVYVFEAPTGKRRDYIVKGLRSVISRLSYHLIAGNVTVCAELYSEDAGQLTGELPSLLTPTQALSRVTHAFLDQQ